MRGVPRGSARAPAGQARARRAGVRTGAFESVASAVAEGGADVTRFRAFGEVTMGDGDAVRLHCFAHAGSGVSVFRRWERSAGSGVHVSARPLPGRDGRRREPGPTGRAELLADLAPLFAQVAAEPLQPYVLYGHSLGALVAVTAAQGLREAGLPMPALLALGACPPPDAPAPLAGAADLPDGELLRVLDAFGALPPGGVRPGDVWFRTVLPVLRADLRLAGALRAAAVAPGAPAPLDVPLLVVAGHHDPLADSRAVAGRQRWTTGRFVQRGDFFVRGGALPRLLGRAARVVLRTHRPPACADRTERRTERRTEQGAGR